METFLGSATWLRKPEFSTRILKNKNVSDCRLCTSVHCLTTVNLITTTLLPCIIYFYIFMSSLSPPPVDHRPAWWRSAVVVSQPAQFGGTPGAPPVFSQLVQALDCISYCLVLVTVRGSQHIRTLAFVTSSVYHVWYLELDLGRALLGGHLGTAGHRGGGSLHSWKLL
jgi:hypothetical protein